MEEAGVGQVAISELADKLWDVVIAGAGPAGATAALRLASLGHQVLLLDARQFPREKVCGDALNPYAVGRLKELGLYEAVRERAYLAEEVVVSSPSRKEVRLPGGSLMIKRERFDALLAEAAVSKGACFGHGRLTEVIPDGERANLAKTGAGGPALRARVCILATGSDDSLATKSGILLRERPTALAIRHYVRSSHAIRELTIAYDRSILPGYAWIFPLGGGEYNVGCGLVLGNASEGRHDLRRMLATFEAQYPPARALMSGLISSSPVKGGALRCGLRRVTRAEGRILAIGETIGATLPFTGEGVGKAIATGLIAADAAHEAIETGRPSGLRSFGERLEEALRPKFEGYSAAQAFLSRPRLCNLAIARAAKSARLHAAFAGIVDESVDPREVFSMRGLWKSLWS